MSHILSHPPKPPVLARRLTLLAGAVAVALAGIGASARPARADANDILRFLAGAIVIGAIVNAIDDNGRPRYVDRWVLPGECLETIRVRNRNIDSYNARCLSRAGYNGLPGRCRQDFRVNGYMRTGYIAECLYDEGYRVEGRYQQPYYQRPFDDRPYDHRPGGHRPGDHRPGDRGRDGHGAGDHRPGDARPGDDRPRDDRPRDDRPGGPRLGQDWSGGGHPIYRPGQVWRDRVEGRD